MTSALEDRRDYTHRVYTPEMVSEAISIFMKCGGSLHETMRAINAQWGYSPSEPTIRKWVSASNEAMNLLDQRTAYNLQQDVAQIMELCNRLLVQSLEDGSFPVSKAGTLYKMMIDTWIQLNKIRNEKSKDAGTDIIGDELFTDRKELMEAIVNNTQIKLD